VTADPLQEMLHSFTRSAWRWECQGEYAVDAAAVQRWRDGWQGDAMERRPWLDYIRDITARGRRFERTRMLTEPLTEHLRWLLDVTYTNVGAGEDIRWITESEARELQAPTYDFYLFDDERVAIMRFGPDRFRTGVEMIEDPIIVAEHCAFRDRVWQRATRHADYASRSP
jgi:hypothetical protein